MSADESSFVCGAANAHALARGAARSWLLGLLGVGIGIGEAYVGHVGNNEVSDFTAIGDIVNTVARLQSAADGGQVVVPTSLATLAGVAGRTETLSLRGKSEPVSVRIMAA